MGRERPEQTRMLYTRDERHTLTVALMISIDQLSRISDDSPAGVGMMRRDLLPKMRALLERLSD